MTCDIPMLLVKCWSDHRFSCEQTPLGCCHGMRVTYYAPPAQVMELVDMLDLGSSAFVA